MRISTLVVQESMISLNANHLKKITIFLYNA